MKMEVFEFGVYTRGEIVAGFNDLDKAVEYACIECKKEHRDVDIINSFTGEVHKSYSCYFFGYKVNGLAPENLEKYYEVKERVW